jgi:flagellar biosynthesis/type III secretory pathway chaperone
VPEVQELIEALREELAECGAMLVLLDQQQKLIINRRPEALLKNAGSMSAQIESLAVARSTRQRLSHQAAVKLECSDFASFSQLVDRSPSHHRCLLRALVGEINCILFHCQQRLLQNKLLLGPPLYESPLTLKDGALVVFGLN